VTGLTNAPITAGPVHAENLTMAGFNLGANLRTIASLAGVETGSDTRIQSFDATIRVAPEGVRLDKMKAIIAGMGTLTGAGTIAADHRLDFHLVAQLSKGGGVLGQLMKASGLGQMSTLPFQIEGTTVNPKFVPEVNSILGSQASKTSTQGAQQQNPLNGLMNLFKKKK